MRSRLLPHLAMVTAISFSCLEGQNALAEEPLRISGKTMGSYYAVVVDSPGSTNATDLQAEIEATFATIGRQMSTWDENSEISRFNRSTSTEWFSVGKDFAIVVREAKRVHEISGGAFDPTL